jgi:hypothetical protein
VEVVAESSNDQDLPGGNREGWSNAVSNNVDNDRAAFHSPGLRMSQDVTYYIVFSHGLYPKGLELPMPMMQRWPCIDV